MAKPRIFISSTFYDLKHIRSSIENFIDSIGYESILSEKGSIAFNPDIPLDESCYRELQTCDIFVLIMGGRYGSPNSIEDKSKLGNFYSRYESITKTEYENAVKKNIPVYILIEKSVYSEYDTFKYNRENDSIKYAHVDSVNVFNFIEEILNQPRNNPIHQFERHIDIEGWLKQQWAGLFQELIRKRKTESEIAELSKEVKELSNINTTLKRYLEELVSTTDNIKGNEIIKDEEKRLTKSRIMNKFFNHEFVKECVEIYKLSPEVVREIISKPSTFDDLAKLYSDKTGYKDSGKRLIEFWKTSEYIQKSFNDLRSILGLSELKWK